jgi:dihydrofolate reductase
MLVQTLLEHRLIDELRLMIFPIVLGSGKRLFGEVSDPPTMVLDKVKTVGEGVVILTYRAG